MREGICLINSDQRQERNPKQTCRSEYSMRQWRTSNSGAEEEEMNFFDTFYFLMICERWERSEVLGFYWYWQPKVWKTSEALEQISGVFKLWETKMSSQRHTYYKHSVDMSLQAPKHPGNHLETNQNITQKPFLVSRFSSISMSTFNVIHHTSQWVASSIVNISLSHWLHLQLFWVFYSEVHYFIMLAHHIVTQCPSFTWQLRILHLKQHSTTIRAKKNIKI